MKKNPVVPPPIVNARWLTGAVQTKGATLAGPPCIVNARWLNNAVQAKGAASPGPPPALLASAPHPANARGNAPFGSPTRSLDAARPPAGVRKPPPNSGPSTAVQRKESLTASNIARAQSLLARHAHSTKIAGRQGLVQRAVAVAMAPAQAAPAFLQVQTDWCGSDELEPLRAWRGEDAQAWLETEIEIRKKTEGNDGNPETFDAFIARNYAIVELTSATGATFIGRGVSAGSGAGIHGEREAFRRAVKSVPAAPAYDWTNADHASLWTQKGVRISRIWSDRELCTGAQSCFDWAGRVCGGNGVTTVVNFGVRYNTAGKIELKKGLRSQLIHYLEGEAKQYFELVTAK